MTDDEIYVHFKAVLDANLPFTKVVPPNCDSFPQKPYLLIDVMPIRRFNRSLSGGIEQSEGICQITLVSETDEDELASLKKANSEIVVLYPYGLRMGNEVLVTKPPDVKNGYRDGPDWRTPIHIEYLAHTGV